MLKRLIRRETLIHVLFQQFSYKVFRVVRHLSPHILVERVLALLYLFCYQEVRGAVEGRKAG